MLDLKVLKKISWVLLSVAFLGGCIQKSENKDFYRKGNALVEQWIHAPLHPGNHQPVTFSLKAQDHYGISKVELYVYEYELYKNEEDLPSRKKRKKGKWGLLKTWEFDQALETVNLNHTYRNGFPAESNVQYHFKVYDSHYAITEKLALFDAGDSPWPKDKILLYSTNTRAMKEKINLCFIPDVDYEKNWSMFLRDTEKLIYKGYFQNNMLMGDKKEHWSFYYSQTEGDGMTISQAYTAPEFYPEFARKQIIEGIDAFGILHRSEYKDGTYMKGNFSFLAFDMFTTESYNYGTALHETAHAIFKLNDGYDGCVCFETAGGTNVFNNLYEVQNFNLDNGFPVNQYTQIRHKNGSLWYMAEQKSMFPSKTECENYNASLGVMEPCEKFIDIYGVVHYRSEQAICIMQDDGDDIVRDFQPACAAVINNYYDRLDPRFVEPMISQTRDEENIFGYEDVAVLEFGIQEGKKSMIMKSRKMGVPTKEKKGNHNAFVLKGNDHSGAPSFEFEMSDPFSVHVHDHSSITPVETDVELNRKQTVTVPYTDDLQQIEFTTKQKAKAFGWAAKHQEKELISYCIE